MNLKIISFLGPRLKKDGEIGYFGEENKEPQASIIKKIDELVKQHGAEGCVVVSSLQSGVETWAVESAIRNKVPFILKLPFPDQEKVYPDFAQRKYTSLASKAESAEVLSENNSNFIEAIKLKDEVILETSDIVYSFYTRNPPSFKNCNKVINPMVKKESVPVSDGSVVQEFTGKIII